MIAGRMNDVLPAQRIMQADFPLYFRAPPPPFNPIQGPEELFETVSQALLSGQDRDCLAGWGAVVNVM